MRKFVKVIAAAGTLSLSAAAYALPAAVPQNYYDKLPHRMDVWAGSPGFRVQSPMSGSSVCQEAP